MKSGTGIKLLIATGTFYSCANQYFQSALLQWSLIIKSRKTFSNCIYFYVRRCKMALQNIFGIQNSLNANAGLQ